MIVEHCIGQLADAARWSGQLSNLPHTPLPDSDGHPPHLSLPFPTLREGGWVEIVLHFLSTWSSEGNAGVVLGQGRGAIPSLSLRGGPSLRPSCLFKSLHVWVELVSLTGVLFVLCSVPSQVHGLVQ